jgi:uncharacterized protein (TIGR03437 family)
MNSFVCRTVYLRATVLIAAVALGAPLTAQTSSLLDWRRVGGTAVDLSLASLAGGPIDRVWYSADGSRLYARTPAGRVWQTDDFETWKPGPQGVDVPELSASVRTIAGDAVLERSHPLRSARTFAAGAFVFRSDDGGLNWSNVSAVGARSILGGRMTDLALSPRDPDEVVVAGANGIWRSVDGGDSWTGLNDTLANFPVDRILESDAGGNGIRVVSNGTELIWQRGERVAWRPASGSTLADEEELRSAAAAATGVTISAVAASTSMRYAGSSDGRLLFSTDRGANWGLSGLIAGAGRVVRIRIDGDDANAAVAITQSRAAGRVLRTTTAGVFWEDLTGNLPVGVAVHGIVTDRASTAIYVATSRGVYLTYADASAGSWTLLRAGSATDVALDAAGNQLFLAWDGAGIFAALAPHRLRDPRVVSAADRMTRAAAPGSLLSVIGVRARSASVGERNVPVLATTDGESQIQIPFDIALGAAQLSTATGTGARRLELSVNAVAPSIFIDRDGVPLVMNADTGLVLDPGTPARSGSRLQILATGLGRVRPDWPTGLPAPLDNPPAVLASTRAFLAGEPVEVTRATLAPGYIGMYLIEVQLPSLVDRGTVDFYIEAQGRESNRIRIELEP